MPWFPPYIPVGARRARVARVSDELRRNGVDVQPVHIEGRTIARSFWGRRWCDHLESCSDFENRLPRGRAYVRNGSVCHLDVHAGGVDAMVVGSDLYHVVVRIRKLGKAAWKAIRVECAGRVGSVLELLQGRLSDHVLRVVTDPARGLFPKPGEITLTCDCPDWAVMCKHAAAVLYGVGSRLDERPELLFRLRDVDAEDLVVGDMALPDAAAGDDVLAGDLADIFGIDLDPADSGAAAARQRTTGRRRPGRGRPRRTGAPPAGFQPDRGGCAAGKRPAGRSPSEPVRRTPCKCCTGKSRNARPSDRSDVHGSNRPCACETPGAGLGAVLNSPGKHPFADAGSGGPAARREVEVGLFRRVADRASELGD